MIAFGPIPSRRLGQSLGVNHIPPKSCSYDCVYCQVGRTAEPQTGRREFYSVGEVSAAVEARVAAVRAAGGSIDYLTFVPDGEPTLDRNLGAHIGAVRPLGIRVAVISNGSLAWKPDVRADLREADLVCVKVDALDEEKWRAVNRPAPGLELGTVLEGLAEFARGFEGTLITETMLVAGLNDDAASVRDVARFIASLRPETAYILVPTRPPAEGWVEAPEEVALNRAYQLFAEHLPRVELVAGFEGTGFAHTGDARTDLLGITAVHPLRDDAARELIARDGEAASLLDELAAEGLLRPVEYGGRRFWVRTLRDLGG